MQRSFLAGLPLLSSFAGLHERQHDAEHPLSYPDEMQQAA